MSSNERQKITLVTAKDCEFTAYCGSGAGGQARNKVHSAMMCKHIPSGAIGRCSESRSQLENKQKAFRRMAETPKFKVWVNRRLYEIQQGESMEKTVERMMEPQNLVVEVKRDGKWVPEDEASVSP
jgi:protein subunit release factor A